MAGNDSKVQLTDSEALAAILNWAEEIPLNRQSLLKNQRKNSCLDYTLKVTIY